MCLKKEKKESKKDSLLKFELIAGSECICREWHGCIMAQSIVGLENVQPYTFSECSKTDYIESLRSGNGFCLLNKPNEVRDQGDQVRKSSFTLVVEGG